MAKAMSTVDRLTAQLELERKNTERVKKTAHNRKCEILRLRARDETRALLAAEKKIVDMQAALDTLRKENKALEQEILRIIKAHAMRERYGK